MAQNTPMQNSGRVIMGGNEGASSYVDGAELKQVDTPVETLLGAANGALSGGMLAVGSSAAVTYLSHHGKEMAEPVGALIMKNIKDTHFIPVVGATAAFAALGAVVRNARARNHNNWADKQYALLQQQSQSHTDRLQAEDTAAPAKTR